MKRARGRKAHHVIEPANGLKMELLDERAGAGDGLEMLDSEGARADEEDLEDTHTGVAEIGFEDGLEGARMNSVELEAVEFHVRRRRKRARER